MTDNHNTAKALRVYYQDELEGAIKQMKLGGATLEQVVVELDVLAEWLRKQAAELPVRWGTLLTGTPSSSRRCRNLTRSSVYLPNSPLRGLTTIICVARAMPATLEDGLPHQPKTARHSS